MKCIAFELSTYNLKTSFKLRSQFGDDIYGKNENRIFIFGLGYIGASVAKALQKSGWTVRMII
jgi:hypothetical protein